MVELPPAEGGREASETGSRPSAPPPAGSAAPAGTAPRSIQVFYSIVLPASGRLDEASGYLLWRPLGGDREDDGEIEIGLAYTESERAERRLDGLLLRLDWRGRWEASISYAWGPPRAGLERGVRR